MNSFTAFCTALGDRIVVQHDAHAKARCPAHNDHTPSLEISHQAGRTLLNCHAGCATGDVVRAVGLSLRDLYDDPEPMSSARASVRHIVRTYPYEDEAGGLLFEKVRYEPKDFRIRRPDGQGGWHFNRQGVEVVLYRRPALARAKVDGGMVFVVEGEKDVETLEHVGLVATCNADGAAKEGQRPKWNAREANQLAGISDIVVLPDNDAAGEAHAAAVVRSLHQLHPAPRVRVVRLPGVPLKGDVSDWMAAGGTREHLLALVEAAPVEASTAREGSPRERAPGNATPDQEDAELGPDITEEGLALEYSARYHERLKFCSTLGGWQHYDAVCWSRDHTRLSYSLSRELVRDVSQRTQLTSKQYGQLRKASTINAIVSLASADRRHAVTQEQFDRDPWVLNTPAGVVDLRTGSLRPHQSDDLCTKATTAAPSGEAPRWVQFLQEVTGNDPELIAYLQRFAGYCLTGFTQEHALVFVYGTGGNGKSVFLNTLLEMVGTYGMQAPMSIFEEKAHESHPTELAMLKGARLVVATETEEGRRWAESRIKVMTGGDPITARFMRGDFFTYQPQFKPVIAGNHRPGFRNPDEAIRRRLHLVPFVQTFSTPDRDLSARLRAEAGGILRWAIEGCLQWQNHGLAAPESVRAATSDYLEEQDVVREWLEECTEPAPGSFTANPELWASWQQWANARGIFTRSKTWVTAGLARHGYESAKMRQNGGQHRGVLGLRLTARESAPDLLGHLRHGGDISTSHARAHTPAHAHTRTQTERQYVGSVSQVSHPTAAKVLVTWRGGDQVVLDAQDRDLTLMREHIAKVEPYVEAA